MRSTARRGVVAAIVLAMLATACGDDGGGAAGPTAPETVPPTTAATTLPPETSPPQSTAPSTTSTVAPADPLDAVVAYEVIDRTHTDAAVTYPQDPPVGGAHAPIWQECEFYDAPVRNEHAVHSLEHGAVWIAYRPDLDPDTVEMLAGLTDRFEVLVSPYPGLDVPVVATAWGIQLRLAQADEAVLRDFVDEYRDGPDAPEPEAGCNDGRGIGVAGLGPAGYAAFREQPAACGAETPPPAMELQYEAPGDQEAGDTVTATITTSCGDIVVSLDPGAAPETVNSFVFLAEQGFFDGTVSHRVVPGFVIQAGDPTGTGRGGPGYVIPDEFPAESTYHRGTVAMANAGPGTTGSQFFVVLADAPLPPEFSILGTVIDGMDVADRIAQVPLGTSPSTGEQSTPLETVYLETVTVESG
jgi:cyclophilin family peptidyl-prolyl cis-trans isomerase